MAIKIDRESADVKLVGHDNFAVVEPNHLSAPRAGGVYGQLPAAKDIDVLENGQFVKYDYAAGEINFSGEGPWMLVFNEEKLYDERKQMHRDWAQKREDAYDGEIYPRVFRVYEGDIYTTNALTAGEYSVGDKVTPGDDGWLKAGEGDLTLKVVKETTLPDGQPAVKLQVIAE